MKKRKGVDRRMLGVTALNPWAMHESSSRSLMFASQLSQTLAINKPEPRYILSGLETEFAKANFYKEIPANSVILEVMPYFGPSQIPEDDDPLKIYVLYYNIDNNTVDYIEVSRYDKYDKKFGFQHTFTDELRELMPSNRVYKEPIKLTKTNSEVSDGEYGFGVNLALAPVTDAVASEDATIISRSAAEKLAFYTYETTIFSFGGDTVPLNIHGDENEYKILKDVGEKIGESCVILATRDVKPLDFFPALFTHEALREFDPTFDKVWSASHKEGTVIDIEVLQSPLNSKYTMYEKSYEQMNRYAEAQAEFRTKFIERANYHINNRPGCHAGKDLHPKLMRDMRVESPDIKNTYKQDPLSEYMVKVTIRYLNIPTLKHKLTTIHGSKGIVSEVRDDEDMYIDANGIRADIILHPNSTMHRMNLGSKYEGVQTTATYLVDKYVKDRINESSLDSSYKELFQYVLGFIKLFGNEQYELLSSLNDRDQRLFIKDIYRGRLQIVLPVDNPDDHTTISMRIKDSIYAPKIDYFMIPTKDGMKKSKNKGMMEMTYILILNKTGETGLATASAKLNHFGLPTSPNPELKQRLGYNATPTKILSETETRLIASTAGPEALLELRNRSLNQNSHHLIYDHLLKAEYPSNIEDIIDREKYPIDGDRVTTILDAVLSVLGLEFKTDK